MKTTDEVVYKATRMDEGLGILFHSEEIGEKTEKDLKDSSKSLSGTSVASKAKTPADATAIRRSS